MIFLLVANFAAFATATEIGWYAASIEDGPIEDAQIALLVGSLLVGVLIIPNTRKLLRVAIASWIAVMLWMIGREFAFGTLSPQNPIQLINDRTVRLILWLGVCGALGFWASRHRSCIVRALPALTWRHLWPFFLVGVFMFGGGVAEQLAKASSHHSWIPFLDFVEELGELNGYCVALSIISTIALRITPTASAVVVEARNTLDPVG